MKSTARAYKTGQSTITQLKTYVYKQNETKKLIKDVRSKQESEFKSSWKIDRNVPGVGFI